ncbi:hypothetical protein [Natronorarus salvus]
MAIAQPTDTYSCPRCHGRLTPVRESWNCEDCGFAPRHGAD